MNIKFVKTRIDHQVNLGSTSASSSRTTKSDESKLAEVTETTISESTIVNDLVNAFEQL